MKEARTSFASSAAYAMQVASILLWIALPMLLPTSVRAATENNAASAREDEGTSASHSETPVASPVSPGTAHAEEIKPMPSDGAIAAMATPAPHKVFDVAFTTAIAVPQPLTIGVQVHRVDSPFLDVFYEAGFFKYPLTDSTRSVSDYSFATGVRYHPFHNWFYTSADIGYRQIGVQVDLSNLKQDGVALAKDANLNMGTFFLGLLIGGEWHLSQNVAVAFDLGIQLALLHTGHIDIHPDPAADDGTDLSVDDSKEMSRISGLPLPQIALLRLVWYM